MFRRIGDATGPTEFAEVGIAKGLRLAIVIISDTKLELANANNETMCYRDNKVNLEFTIVT